ncbi:hypothetical protein [Brachybacterium sp. GPGPB12]|uniref:hypothetical protein n=1 Tax=Brachybacterium sp. GPGPB12 TaxID=3023517 RepID=UPI003134264E
MLAALLTSTHTAIRDGSLAQHLSFFTNQSNLAFAVLLLAGTALSRRRRPPWWDDLRGAAAFYLVMTGTIYAPLVAPLDESAALGHRLDGDRAPPSRPGRGAAGLAPDPAAPHPVGPAGPGMAGVSDRVSRRDLGARGVTGWYPYAFLDPTASSWPQVLATTGVVLVAFLLFAALVHLAEARARRQEVPAGPPQRSLG